MSTLPVAPPQVVIGTAGHIDHGKTALVEALTGTHADRLPEERERGMSIELGFAFCPGADHGQALDLGFIDCPGHARFVRQAIAGMGAMDGCLLIVAADEGINAQTVEHLELLRLFALHWGRVVLTKCDLVDAATVARRRDELAALVSGSVLAAEAPLAVSAHAGTGVDELREWLFAQAAGALERRAVLRDDPPRLAVDRVFTVAGHGTVVTGTLQQGTLTVGDAIACHPGPASQVRGLQVRGLAVERAEAGQRTAVNLARIKVEEVDRGAWLARGDDLRATTAVDIRLTPVGPGVRHGQTLVVHHGTRQIPARVSLYEVDHADDRVTIGQLRLAEPCYLGLGARLILRRASPPANLGVAEVVAVDAPRHKRFRAETRAWFEARSGDDGQKLAAWLEAGYPAAAERREAERWIGGAQRLAQALDQAGLAVTERTVGSRHFLWSTAGWLRLRETVLDQLARSQRQELWQSADRLKRQLAPDCPDPAWEDRLADLVTRGDLVRDRSLVCAPAAVPPLPDELRPAAAELLAHYEAAGLQAGYNHPTVAACRDPAAAERALEACAARGWLVRLSDRQHLARSAVAAVVTAIAEAFRAGETVDFQWFKRRFELTRRHALPLAEWCDAVGLTQRHDSERRPAARLDLHRPRLPLPVFGEPPEQPASDG